MDRDVGFARLLYVVVSCSFRLLCFGDDVVCSYRGNPEVLDVVEDGLPFMRRHVREFSVEGLEAEGNECR